MVYQWAVIGAGPAGIAAVGKLLDSGIHAKEILWIDPKFTVGDFGTIWRNVPSNTKAGLFLKFLHAAKSFEYNRCPKDFELNHIDPEQTCYLRFMVEPLQWISDHLRQQVNAVERTALNLSLINNAWTIELDHEEYLESKNIILAVGAEPKTLAHPGVTVVPLQDAMDEERLFNHVEKNNAVAVFGSSHSAVLVLRNLVDCGVTRIINFYRSPLRYAVYLKDWILFDDTGLKGSTADWARQYLDGKLPRNLERVYSSRENIEHYLPFCDKVVYAVGFERRLLPTTKHLGHLDYIEQCGIIAPGLFGLGIAFPEAKVNPFGVLEYRVGLWKFMEYLDMILPVWLNYVA